MRAWTGAVFLEKPGEAGGVSRVERELLPYAERDFQLNVRAVELGVPGEATGQRAERLAQFVLRLRPG